MKKKFIPFILIGTLFCVFIYIYYYIYIWEYSGVDKFFEVKEGEAFSKINYKLKQEAIVADARIFYRYVQVMDAITSIKNGVYVIPSGTNMQKLLEILTIGDLNAISVTIPEGKNIYEIGDILEQNNITKAKVFIEKAKDKRFLESIGIHASIAEGFLYPNTYKFSRNVSVETIIKSMNREFNKRIKEVDFSNSPLSFSDTLVLASIVEKETSIAKERPIIAGVFLNRLSKKMRLQSDPSTIYGIFENYDGNLRKDDLHKANPYNTYKISALPPTPICNPGIASIKAVIKADKHSYLYFVSKNDGTHIFSIDYNHHINNVNCYQKNPENRKNKSWRNLKQK
ncbi:MAG: endolytic transglycosylase MltG [Oligoflexia bacterium]|nr:endolytic transglycosylase MltG [Oligoflexia bacterium]